MLVSWKWLSRYVDLPMSHEELAHRLSLSGLNHEGTETIGDDISIDLEVTSNRGDCLGHIGVAREVSVLYQSKLTVPEPKLVVCEDESIDDCLTVENQFIDACPRYTARVIKGVTVGPSPDWMIEELQAASWRRVKEKDSDATKIELYKPINNVVDATNYVALECGQPLHAFDYASVADQKIIVRPAHPGEKLEAINHNEYTLDESMCVIADGQRASAVAGVMGGAFSEVTDSTTDLVIEAAIFTPLSVRRTARKLKLHSPSSYRFERRVDPLGVDWASRRVCDLIVQMAGGTVVDGVIDTAPKTPQRKPIVLRLHQIERILGIEIGFADVNRILTELGCSAQREFTDASYEFVPPSWRHDLTREADLIEEVARIHGYEKIPEDAPIPVAPSSRRPFDTAIDRIRHLLTASGLSEAMTPSVVTEKLDELISPWTDVPALQTETPMLEGSKWLRRSLIPSLLSARGGNWANASLNADLFEIAHIYVPADASDTLPSEQYSLGIVTGVDFFRLKGILETLCERMGIDAALDTAPITCDGMLDGSAVQLKLGDSLLGYLGMVQPSVLRTWKLPEPVCAAELSLQAVLEAAQLVPQQKAVSTYPSVQRDLNFVVAETVRWNEIGWRGSSRGGK